MGKLGIPLASSVNARATMRATRRRDTAPELALRSELHGRGLRFRVDFPPIPGLRCRADIVFTRVRVAVFVDGCFWHACPEHATWPKANAGWWLEKLEGNARRDRANDRALEAGGWRVLRFWEHEDAAAAADVVEFYARDVPPRSSDVSESSIAAVALISVSC